ncbi:Endonuclease/exonuclease/phosphatase domain-containing protein [Caenorhabditis elegans]|nr:Endonuclease/exonuclease/phosphatase domain-containing protein [Caenorhabditis elegans]CUR30050.1 Endonuclease/exonuclease/phosphatase domain-containing protein [Caenorhabditis elegans]|eukprot:NP_001303751.1 ANGeL-like deadenylase [Caenorhabditis elegans]
MYRPPPKPIKTIRLGDDEATPGSSSSPPSLHAPSSVDQQQQQPTTSSNFCASWLAKNQHLTRTKKVEEVVLDERPTGSQDDSIIVLDDDIFEKTRKKSSEPRDLKKKVFGRQEPGTTVGRIDSQDGIVFVGEYPRRGRTMTQLETNMAETFWSNGASSSSPSSTGTTQQTFKKINDGFSRDCKDFKRLVRCWNRTEAQSRSKIPKISSKFTICSYNVLCQKTIARTDYLYRHLQGSAQFLDWEHRWRGLQVELPTFDADILGLQEVQADHFVEHFQPLMKKYGYEGVYKQKFGTQQKDDGCALFYHPAKFELVANQEVNYFISDTAISNRENIAQIVALRCRITKELILVANTHLLFNEERGDVKLAQLAILFASIHKMREDFAPMVPPVFVMGDFNIEPNSKVYDFIVDGRTLKKCNYSKPSPYPLSTPYPRQLRGRTRTFPAIIFQFSRNSV